MKAADVARELGGARRGGQAGRAAPGAAPHTLRDGFERGAFAQLVQMAAALDRMLGHCQDRDLAAKLTPIRGTISAAVDELGERCRMVQRTPEQLAYYRRYPWDKP